MNIAGMIAKYLATSFAIEKVVSAPRVMSSCFPISTTSMSLVGLESRSIMFPASFAACVPLFMATPTSACASAGASLVPSPATGLLALDQRHLVLGRRLGEEFIHTGFFRYCGGSKRIVPRDHHRADAHGTEAGKTLADSALYDVLEIDHAKRARDSL